MPGFLRRKSASVAKSGTLSQERNISTPTTLKPQNTTSGQDVPSTPLYERFTSGATPVIGGPMALGSQRPSAAPRQNSQQQQRPTTTRVVSAPNTKHQRTPSSQHPPESRPMVDKPLPQLVPEPETKEIIKPVQRGVSLQQSTRRTSLQQSQQPRLGNAIVPRRVDYSEPEPLHRPPPKRDTSTTTKTSLSYSSASRRLSTAEKSYEPKSILLTLERRSGESTRPNLEAHHHPHHLAHKRDSIRSSQLEPSPVNFRSSGYQPNGHTSPPPVQDTHFQNGTNGYATTTNIPAYDQTPQPMHQRSLPHSQPSSPSLPPNQTMPNSRKPLIFASIDTGPPPEVDMTPRPQPPAASYWDNRSVPYPTPPQEFAPTRSPTIRRELPRPPVQPAMRNFTSPPAMAPSSHHHGYAPSPASSHRPITPDFAPVPRQAATPENSPPQNRHLLPRGRKESKASEVSLGIESSGSQRDSFISANSHLDQEYRSATPPKSKVLMKNRPTTPTPRVKERPVTPNSHKKDRPETPISSKRERMATPPPRTALLPAHPVIVNGITIEGANSAELLDSDPFAKTEGVLVYGANGHSTQSVNNLVQSEPDAREKLATPSPPLTKEEHRSVTPSRSPPPRHDSPPKYELAQSTRKHRHKDEKRHSHGHKSHSSTSSSKLSEVIHPLVYFPLARFLSSPVLLGNLLRYLSFSDWCNLSAISKKIRHQLHHTPQLREEILERYLWTVGYSRWEWGGRESLSISVKQLHQYMRGVSIPTYQYAQVSQSYLNAVAAGSLQSEDELRELAAALAAGTRAYTRLVCRVRAQIEAEQALENQRLMRSRSGNFPLNRAPSPSRSMFSSHHGHGQTNGLTVPPRPVSPVYRSPLYKPRRAPLLRLFVPSPDGDWLSDASVLQCEAELKTSIDGLLGMLRVGDVVWDLALGDEGNVGRMIWDGCYLIDLDYTFSPVGDLPKYIHTLAFPPSYFHRVIRSGPGSGNPIAHIDISPWGEEIASNLQLLQDRIRTETPQGTYHNVVRWVHRSTFQVRPQSNIMTRSGSSPYRQAQGPPRIPIPGVPGAFVDSGWYGTIVVETEGTNEHLADLQDRCGPRAFPHRKWSSDERSESRRKELKYTYRILREKSRPGEIWIRTVSEKEMKL